MSDNQNVAAVVGEVRSIREMSVPLARFRELATRSGQPMLAYLLALALTEIEEIQAVSTPR